MREPDLVRRAERAATALEQAWMHWRVRHGLGSGSPPPVSSYVGYSLEEPWGQPRVVLGVEAADAERLAAILEGHDCVGPVHAEISGRSDWRHEAGVPLVAWPLPAGESTVRPATTGQIAAGRARPAEAEWAAAGPPELSTESADLPAALRQAAATADLPPEPPAQEAAQLKKLAARSSGRSARPGAVPANPLTSAAGYRLAAAPVDPVAVEQPPIAAPRPRSASHDEQHDVAQDADAAAEPEMALEEQASSAAEPEIAAAAAGDTEAEPEAGAEAAGIEPGDEDKPAGSARSRIRSVQVSKLNRTRKPGPGRGARWPSADKAEQANSDSAV